MKLVCNCVPDLQVSSVGASASWVVTDKVLTTLHTKDIKWSMQCLPILAAVKVVLRVGNRRTTPVYATVNARRPIIMYNHFSNLSLCVLSRYVKINKLYRPVNKQHTKNSSARAPAVPGRTQGPTGTPTLPILFSVTFLRPRGLARRSVRKWPLRLRFGFQTAYYL